MNRYFFARAALYTYIVLAASALLPRLSSASDRMPELFASGVISTPDDEFGIAFMPDGKTAYFTKRSPTTNTPPLSVICMSRLVEGHWTEPAIAPFSGRYNDFGVAISHDGNRIVFSSDRPAGADAKAAHGADLWFIDKQGDGWSEPQNPGAPINTTSNEAYPSFASDGTLYFASNRPGGKGGSDIYRARLIDGHYADPENLTELNSPGYDSQPAIAADQSYLIFASSGRRDTFSAAGAPYERPDLYVSFRTTSGWTPPRNLGAPINSPANEGGPAISPDGNWFFFSSDRSFVTIPMRKNLTAREYESDLHGLLNGWNNIFRMPITAITRLDDIANDGTPRP